MDNVDLILDLNLGPEGCSLCSRLNKPFLDYGDAVQYGMENVSWLRRHSIWGR